MNEMGWIKCSDRMPELYDFVLVFADNKGTGEPKPMSIARFDGDGWCFINENKRFGSMGAWMDIEYHMDGNDITHWMPLPKPPEEE